MSQDILLAVATIIAVIIGQVIKHLLERYESKKTQKIKILKLLCSKINNKKRIIDINERTTFSLLKAHLPPPFFFNNELQKELPGIAKMVENYNKTLKEICEILEKIKNKMENMFSEELKKDRVILPPEPLKTWWIKEAVSLGLKDEIDQKIDSRCIPRDFEDFLKIYRNRLLEIKNKEEIKNEIEKGKNLYNELCETLNNLYNEVGRKLGYK